MIFLISSTGYTTAKKYEEVLKSFGYQIEEREGWHGMKYEATFVEINSLEEMLKLKSVVKCDIIISEEKYEGLKIEIYDDYRE